MRGMKVFKFPVLCTVILGMLMYPGMEASAEPGLSFSVKAILPENQLDQTVGYFDLRMEPGQVQTLQVHVVNSTDRALTLNVCPTAAVTSHAGEIDYTQKEAKYDDSLEFPFTELVSVEETVAVPPRSSYTLDITVRMPKKRFDGMILGGLYFIEEQAKDMGEPTGELQIKNRFSYTIGVKLTETDTVVLPDMKFCEAYASQVNYRNCVKIRLQNPMAAVIDDLKIDAAVYSEKGSDALHRETKEGLAIAPNSSFDYVIGWEARPFEAGTYRAQVKAEAGGKQWEWEECFVIEKAEARRLNSEAVDLEGPGNPLLLKIVSGGTGILLVMTVILIFIIKRQQKAADI